MSERLAEEIENEPPVQKHTSFRRGARKASTNMAYKVAQTLHTHDTHTSKVPAARPDRSPHQLRGLESTSGDTAPAQTHTSV